MNKTQLIDAIASEAGLTKVQARQALEAVLTTTMQTLGRGEEETIVGFGSFKVAERKARLGMNPQTKQKIEIPAARVVRFKPGSELENAVKK